jgi:hypothetical protein
VLRVRLWLRSRRDGAARQRERDAQSLGITLDRDVAHWAAERALSETVAAALQLIAKKEHPVAAIAAKLTSTELDLVITVVRSWCNEHAFPRGVLAALEGQRAHSLACSYASAGNRGHGRG